MLTFSEALALANTPKDDTKGLSVGFEMKPVLNKHLSDEAGRDVYDEIEYIHIELWADKKTTYYQPITEKHRDRFRAHYEAWKAGIELPETGLPLREWGGISRARAEELCSAGIKTVETLADLGDGVLKKLGATTFEERKRARALLSPDNAVDALKVQIEELQRENEKLAANQKKAPGRKPNASKRNNEDGAVKAAGSDSKPVGQSREPEGTSESEGTADQAQEPVDKEASG